MLTAIQAGVGALLVGLAGGWALGSEYTYRGQQATIEATAKEAALAAAEESRKAHAAEVADLQAGQAAAERAAAKALADQQELAAKLEELSNVDPSKDCVLDPAITDALGGL